MKLIPQNILQPLKEKGFTGDSFCEAVDFFREEKNIFIQYYWMIDEPANGVAFYFKIDYMCGYKEKEKTYTEWAKRNDKVKAEKWYDEYDECQIKSIAHATEFLEAVSKASKSLVQSDVDGSFPSRDWLVDAIDAIVDEYQTLGAEDIADGIIDRWKGRIELKGELPNEDDFTKG